MTDLDDDIARIAALRGKRAEDYLNRPAPVQINRVALAQVFLPDGPDFAAYDCLPNALRAWMQAWPNNTNAKALLALLDTAGGDVKAVLKALPAPPPETRFARRRPQ